MKYAYRRGMSRRDMLAYGLEIELTGMSIRDERGNLLDTKWFIEHLADELALKLTVQEADAGKR